MHPETRKWYILPSSLIHSDWDGERIVYHFASGETHFLNAMGARLIDRLLASPASLDDLLLYACRPRSDDFPAREELRSQVIALLRRFDELGLVVSSAPASGP
jgi:PqqD family protein of HPr-rel-A system